MAGAGAEELAGGAETLAAFAAASCVARRTSSLLSRAVGIDRPVHAEQLEVPRIDPNTPLVVLGGPYLVT